jgi:hypothetical protein
MTSSVALSFRTLQALGKLDRTKQHAALVSKLNHTPASCHCSALAGCVGDQAQRTDTRGHSDHKVHHLPSPQFTNSFRGQLAKGEAADRRLASDIRRFVADMPVPLTRRQALAVELRRVLEQRNAPVPASPPAAPDGVADPRPERRPPLPGDTPPLGPTMPRGRR